MCISPAVRGKGLGAALAGGVRDHRAPCGPRRVRPAAPDAHEVGAKAGFAPLAAPEKGTAPGER